MVGKALKEKREALGISLQEASSKSQIKLEFLQTLEEESFDLLPDPSYLSGFLRRYAHFLELDADLLVEAFQEQISRPLIAKFEPIQREYPSAWKKWKSPLLLALSALLVLSLFLLLIYRASYRASQKASFQPRTAPAVQPSLPGETREHPASPPARERFLSPAVNEGRHSLSLFAKQRTWLVVQADDDRPREIMLLEGEAISLSAERQFRLTIGNAGGVEMVLDGKRLPTVGSSGQVVRDLILAPP